MTTRRQVLGLTVAGAVAAALRPAWASFLGFGRGRGIPAPHGGMGFYADPYSSYTSYIADTTFAGTNGTSTTVSWNGSTLTAPTYSTIQAAVNAAAAVSGGAAQRVCLLAGQTWTLTASSPITIPALSGTSASAYFVIQGDPAASATTMPILTGANSGVSGFAIAIGAFPPGYGSGYQAANNYVVVRKLEITDFSDSSDFGSTCCGISVSTGSGAGTFSGSIIEYCNIHKFRSGAVGSLKTVGSIVQPTGTLTDGTYTNIPLTGGSGANATATITVSGGVVTGITIPPAPAGGHLYVVGDVLGFTGTGLGTGGTCTAATVGTEVGAGEVGPIYITGTGNTDTIEIRYNKLSDVNSYWVGSTPSTTDVGDNHVIVGMYGGVVNIHHNEIYLGNHGVRFKVCNANIPQNNIVTKNQIHDCDNGISTANGGEGSGPNGILITYNLFYWENINNAVYGSGGASYNDFGSDHGTTVPQNVTFSNNTVSSEYTTGFRNWASATCTVENNIFLCATSVVASNGSATKQASLSACDYNFYFTTPWYVQLYNGTLAQLEETTFAGWQAAYTSNPTYVALTANPDVHGGYIPSFAAGYTTIAENFPNYASYDYTLASASPMKGAGTSGIDPGYIPTDNGPAW